MALRNEFLDVHNAARGNAKTNSGLGLSITKQLVELQGGVIAVESSLGRGSIFKVSMPTRPTS